MSLESQSENKDLVVLFFGREQTILHQKNEIHERIMQLLSLDGAQVMVAHDPYSIYREAVKLTRSETIEQILVILESPRGYCDDDAVDYVYKLEKHINRQREKVGYAPIEIDPRIIISPFSNQLALKCRVSESWWNRLPGHPVTGLIKLLYKIKSNNIEYWFTRDHRNIADLIEEKLVEPSQ